MEFSHFDQEMMRKSISLANTNHSDEVPVGALIVKGDLIIAKGRNTLRKKQTIHQHAEINAINKALKLLKGEKLNDCTLYVTLEPCLMCTGAIVQSRIKRVVIATLDPKGGAMLSSLNINKIPSLNHYPMIESGLLKDQASQLLSKFFKGLRE
jgi:tRNA(adenine34) deaminase